MRRILFLPVLALLFAASARAQIASFYVTYAPIRLSNVETGIILVPANGNETQYASYWANGVGGGVTINLIPLPVVSLGLDLRGSTKPGTLGADTGMIGLKLAIHPPAIPIKPYIEAAAGYLGTRTVSTSIPVGSTNNGTYVAWEVLGGIDYPVVSFLDVRAIEIGGGRGISTGSGSNASIFSVSSGVVVHF
jgi:hypothetical protein